MLGLVLLCQGCSPYTEERAYKEVHKKLAGMDSYSCTAEIFTKGNRQPGYFKIKQWFCMPDRYRLEVLEPAVMKGKTTVFDGQRLWMYYPYIDQVLLLEDMDPSMDENMFLGFFLRDMLETESIQYSIHKEAGETTVVVELPVPGGSKYRCTQKMFIDKKDLRPIMLEIYDINGNVTTRVKYSDFRYNPGLDDDLFDREKAAVSMLFEEWDVSGMFFDSFDEARRYLDFPPLELYVVPEELERDVIQVVETGGGRTLIATYTGGGESITLIQKGAGKAEGESPGGGELIHLDGREAVYSERQGTGKISWTEGGIRVELMGNLTRNALAEMAKNIR